jgi:hypothetical protein
MAFKINLKTEYTNIEHDGLLLHTSREHEIRFEAECDSDEMFQTILKACKDTPDGEFSILTTRFTDLQLLDANADTRVIIFKASVIVDDKKWSRFTGKWEDNVNSV